jgi:polyisoprenyl-phosphate glycosyltransferase
MTTPSAPATTPSAADLELEVSVVVPVYHNAASLDELYRRLAGAMATASVRRWDVTFVDDGSRDESLAVLVRLSQRNGNVRVLRLSRNFGSMAAIQAGLERATGRCVAVISADLQDPPEKLAEMVELWRRGAEVVLAARESREDPLSSRLLSWVFYRAFRSMVMKDMPPGGFDFFVVDRKVARVLVASTEKNANLAAAVLWVGFRREVVPYHRAAREHGTSMWTFWKKVKYMYDSLLSYSYVPLRVMTALGALGMLGALAYAAWITGHRLLGGAEPAGWSSLMVVTLFFNGFVLLSVGTVGEYVWRTLDAARRRPTFIVADVHEPASGADVARQVRIQG